MRYLTLIITSLLLGLTYVGEANGDELKAPSRRVIQVPNPKFTRPTPQRPQIQGKQEWQRPQPQQPANAIERLKAQQRYQFGFGGYNYYRPVNPYLRYYRIPSYYPPVIVQPPVIIQPQPLPVYPAPFHGFFFQFRW